MFSKLTTSVKIFLLQFVQTPVALFNSLYKVVLMSESVNEILKCDHSNESYIEQYFPVVQLHYAVKGGSYFWVCQWMKS